MEIKAKANHVKMSPRKIRLVVDVIRGMEANKALDQLRFAKKLAAKPIIKLVASAIANAVNNFELDKDNLFVKEIRVDDGPTVYRWMPRAHGRATPLRKRTSHVTLALGEIKDSGTKKAKKQKIEAPIKLGEEPKETKEDLKNLNKKKHIKDEENPSETEEEKGKEIKDPRMEGRGGHARMEGKNQKGFMGKMFRRKSG